MLFTHSEEAAHPYDKVPLAIVGLYDPFHNAEPAAALAIEFRVLKSGNGYILPRYRASCRRLLVAGGLHACTLLFGALLLRSARLLDVNCWFAFGLVNDYMRIGPFVVDSRGIALLLHLYFWGGAGLLHIHS